MAEPLEFKANNFLVFAKQHTSIYLTCLIKDFTEL